MIHAEKFNMNAIKLFASFAPIYNRDRKNIIIYENLQ